MKVNFYLGYDLTQGEVIILDMSDCYEGYNAGVFEVMLDFNPYEEMCIWAEQNELKTLHYTVPGKNGAEFYLHLLRAGFIRRIGNKSLSLGLKDEVKVRIENVEETFNDIFLKEKR